MKFSVCRIGNTTHGREKFCFLLIVGDFSVIVNGIYTLSKCAYCVMYVLINCWTVTRGAVIHLFECLLHVMILHPLVSLIVVDLALLASCLCKCS